MKYKIGDKVRVRSDLVVDREYPLKGCLFCDDMAEYLGREVCIKYVDVFYERYIIEGSVRRWTDEMLEDIEPEFTLPDEWCVKCVRQDEVDIVEKYLYGKALPNPYIPKYLTNKGLGNMPGHNPSYFKEWRCNEITFDQFKKYVLKEPEPIIKEEIKPDLSEESLLEEAKRRYPVGTKFKSPENGKIYEVNIRHRTWEGFNKRNILISIDNNWGEFVFHNGKWAEIIETSSKKDIPEYIECIEKSLGFTAGKIYKTNSRSTESYYNVDIDDDGEKNGWDSYRFKPSTKEAFDKQEQRSKQLERPISQKEEELVQTGMNQSDACYTCKYHGKECRERGICMATGGQHYPKEKPEVIIPHAESMETLSMIYNIPWIEETHSDPDEIYVPIIKTEVKQIKL